MTQTLSIDRMINRYRLPAGAAERDDRGDLDRLAVRAMARLEPRLPALLDQAGLRRDSVVILREVRVRLTVDDAAVDPEVLAGAWAQAIERGLRLQLPGGSTATPGAAGDNPEPRRRIWIGDDVAVFADQFAAERTWLREVARGQPAAWWWGPLFAEGGSVPHVGSVLDQWIQRDPNRAIAEMASLVRTDGSQLGSLLDPATASRLLRHLATRRARRLHELTQHTEVSAALRLFAPQLLAALTSDDRVALLSAPHAEARRLYALLLCLDRRPSCHIESVHQLDALSDYLEPTRATEPGSEEGTDGGTPAPGDDSTHPDRRVDEVPVTCGGLLYLIRPLAQTEFVDPRRPELDGRLLALGSMVLETVLGALPAAARDDAVVAELPLLAVFAGRPSLTSDEWSEVRGLAPAECAAALTRLTVSIPEQVAPCPSAAARPLPEDLLARRLAWLVQRPGTLTRTTTHADLTMPLDSIDPALRRAAWDTDPGWVPYLGRVIRFHFSAP